MISRKYLLTSLLLLTIVLPSLVFVSNAQLTQQETAYVGDRDRLVSVRGFATHRGLENEPRINASIALVGEITEINRTQVKIRILEGSIQIGDDTYTVRAGHARALVRKFGWLGVIGNATSHDGSLFKFHLEGMLHIERPKLVVVGLAGLISNEADQYVLRLFTRVERTT